MTRATNSVARNRSKKRVFKRAKGFWGDRKNHFRLTSDAVMRALAFNYKHRKAKKRDFRSLWIQRINAAARINGMSYSSFINGLAKAKCSLDRKTLANMAINDPVGFTAVVETAKAALV